MSMLADIEAAWTAKIWTNATMLAYTDKAIGHDFEDMGEVEMQAISYNTEVNYFTYHASRVLPFNIIGNANGGIANIKMEVEYTRQITPDGSAHEAVVNAIDDLVTLVQQQLGSTWNNTVDFYTVQDSPPTVEKVEVADNPCYRSKITWTAKAETTV